MKKVKSTIFLNKKSHIKNHINKKYKTSGLLIIQQILCVSNKYSS